MNTERRWYFDEVRLCHLANRWGGRASVTTFFGAISRAGDGPFWYALLLVMPLIWGREGLAASLHMGLTALAAIALYKVLKRWTRRPRPFARHPQIRAWVAPLDEFSFPSGHTLHAVSFTLVAIAYYPVLAWLLVPFTLLVAASRVVLGLHYPSDVIAATLVGVTLASISLRLV